MKLILLCVNDKILRQEGCKQAHPVKLNKKIQIKIHTKKLACLKT